MGKRKCIGLFFSYNENWIGGSYYIINLIAALKILPDNNMPLLTIIYVEDADVKKMEELHYPYISFIKMTSHLSLPKKGVNFLYRKMKGVNFYNLSKKVAANHFDAIFPVPFAFNTTIAKKTFYWIPDFQYAHLPNFFSVKELAERKFLHSKIAATNNTVIFSSYDAQKDFNRFYPHSAIKQAVVQFAVTHPTYNDVNFNTLIKKYNLPPEYFFCPNQFWIHKNQQIILEAVALLKKENKNIRIVFSGKNYDPRNIHYFDELKKFIKEKDIESNISFVGFIDRSEQLLIMKNAIAVIQPSLFEGWSTVVEDAKAMNQHIIASNLNVHKEQLEEKGIYFDPYNSSSLAAILSGFKKSAITFDYEKNKLQFATSFINTIND